MKKLQALLETGVQEQVFQTARAVVLHDGREFFHGGPAAADTLFDLASVSKVVGTTAAFLSLSARGVVTTQTRLQSLLPRALIDVTLGDLLLHRSGLPAYESYFEPVMLGVTALFRDECTREQHDEARFRMMESVLSTPQETGVGEGAVYSDLGFILLGEALAAAAGQSLDALVHGVLGPLGVGARYRRLSSHLPLPAHTAATGTRRPREPAPGQESLWPIEVVPSRGGEVDDDNAWVMDGVAGHAGLFSTALDVARFGQLILDGTLAPPTPWAVDRTTPGSTRALGFDTPSAEGASCGARFGRGPKGAIGHLGFTGTSLWIDLDRRLVVVLLTNRTWKGRDNLRIKEFRPRFHDAVLDALG